MNRKQKQAAASLLIRGAADVLGRFDECPESFPESEDLEGIEPEELREQFALWLKTLPGSGWDNRLPEV